MRTPPCFIKTNTLGFEALVRRSNLHSKTRVNWFNEVKNDIEVLVGWLQTSSSMRLFFLKKKKKTEVR